MNKLSPKWQRLVTSVKEAAGNGTWEAVRNDTIRYSEWDVPTPGNLPSNWWPQPTYSRHVFMTLVVGKSVIVGVSRTPWTGRQDYRVTLKRAFEVLDNPAAELALTPAAA